MHIIRLVRTRRDQRVETKFHPVPWVLSRTLWHAGTVILGQIVKEIARRQQCINVIFKGIVGNA